MADIHLFGGEKGGVGKSFVCKTAIAYHLKREIDCVPFDADRSNADVLRSYGEAAGVQTAILSEGEDFDTAANAIFNTAHIGLLMRGLATGNGDWIAGGMSDRIHQPYRKKLISGYSDVRRAAMQAGAWGLVISGAGPTLLALTPADAAEGVREAMESAWKSQSFVSKAHCLTMDSQGAVAKPLHS